MKVLIVDDNSEILTILKNYFESNGHIAITATSGIRGFELLIQKPDIAILDIMLPDIDGNELCRRIREKSNIPILMLSAKSSDIDQIMSLGLGADDYATKPFSPSVILAKCTAMVRRSNALSNSDNKMSELTVGSIYLNQETHIAKNESQTLTLSPKEFDLLSFFMNNLDIVFTKEQLIEKVWDGDFCDITTVTVHVRKLREKIEIDPSNPDYLKTVWGVGYKFTNSNQ